MEEKGLCQRGNSPGHDVPVFELDLPHIEMPLSYLICAFVLAIPAAVVEICSTPAALDFSNIRFRAPFASRIPATVEVDQSTAGPGDEAKRRIQRRSHSRDGVRKDAEYCIWFLAPMRFQVSSNLLGNVPAWLRLPPYSVLCKVSSSTLAPLVS